MRGRPVRRAIGLAAVAIAAGVLAFCRAGPQPSRATFERVRAGMTLEHVVATVGGPPGVYTKRPVPIAFDSVGFTSSGSYREEYRLKQWAAYDGTLVVFLGRDGRVANVSVTEPLPDNRPLTARLWEFLGL